MLTDLDPTVMEEKVKKVLTEELGGKYSPQDTVVRISEKVNKIGKNRLHYESGNRQTN